MDVFKKDELDALDFAGNLRADIIRKFTADGIPDDIGVSDFLLGALKDHEDIQIKKARVRLSDKNADAESVKLGVLKSIMIELATDTSVAIPIINQDPVVLTIPKEHKHEHIEGETDMNHSTISYDELMGESEIDLPPPSSG